MIRRAAGSLRRGEERRVRCNGLCAGAEFQEGGAEEKKVRGVDGRGWRSAATAASLQMDGSSVKHRAEPIQTRRAVQ
jgi:hypothetical protein